MFNYLKWEFKDELRRKKISLIVIAVVFLLVLVLPNESSLFDYVMIPYMLILMGSIAMAYFYGPFRTMNSYQKQTFLLESMIPFPPGKLLLAKYILAIVFDVFYALVFVLGLATMLFKVADFEAIKEIVNLFFQIDLNGYKLLLRVLLVLLSSTIAFTSFVTLVFLCIKSLLPNKKGILPVSYIAGIFLFSIITKNILGEFIDSFGSFGETDIVLSLALIVLSVVCYFASVWFIESKLEVYN